MADCTKVVMVGGLYTT